MSLKFEYTKLDKRTRTLMCEEIIRARDSNNIYFSKKFSEIGKQNWIQLLHTAAEQYDEHWLAFHLEMSGAMKHLKPKIKPWNYSDDHVPDSAADMIASGQFNRFYMLAICRRALEEGNDSVIVYRSRERRDPRPESLLLEGTMKDTNTLLQELRSIETSLQSEILKPNSGLSIDY